MQTIGYKLRRRARGFTLAEILITLTIVGFIGALGVPMLNPQKARKPVELKQNHGTMECFYVGNTLYQYEANNGDNAEGTLKVSSDGACYFAPPRANLFVVQATNAGGDGAVGDGNDKIHYENTSYNPPMYKVSTGSSFLSDMANAPAWVKNNWNEWASARTVTYTVYAPLGAGGASVCEPQIKNTAECLEACAITSAENCPPACRNDVQANGGKSADGKAYRTEVNLYYNAPYETEEGESVVPENDAVTFITNYNEATLQIGTRILTAYSSNPGKPAELIGGNTAKNGENGEGCVGGTCVTSSSFAYSEVSGKSGRNGARGCSNPTPQLAVKGSIQASPSSVSCSGTVDAVRITYGLPGKPGLSEMRLLEKLSGDMRMKLVPAKNINEETVVYVDNGTGAWIEYMRVSLYNTKSDGTKVRNESYSWPSYVYESTYDDLPALSMFRSQLPSAAMTSGLGYRSELASRGMVPGASGAGAHPIVPGLSSYGSYNIGGISVDYGPTGNGSPGWYNCFDGSAPVNGVCGHINTPGTPGGVVITW